jgi:hypothetical protein
MQAFQNRHQRFGRGAVILTARGPEGLTDTEIASACPAVFAPERHSSRSERYTYIPTLELVAGLRRGGLVPFEVRQGGSKSEEKRGYTKHMLRLRMQGATALAAGLGGLIPEVVLLNSHDGTSSYVMEGGLMRVLCTNGLMTGERLVEGVKVPHRGDVIGDVIEGAYRVLEQLPVAIEAASTMSQVKLNNTERLAFATAAASLRWEPEAAQPEPAALLAPRRAGDAGSDLWATFNAVQENLIRGNLGYVSRDQQNRLQHRTTRQVRSIDGDRGINRALWILAEAMQDSRLAA